ncbi:DoxX family protein [Sphingobium lactosutens]|uniref:DoxX family protein n=1 Tax=Sphingobium lactosutens DS20 TaxID=1331060 RepID=T0IN94_9SPHN|nr:DoxX family protein [Sphingobium lactosutens]EQB11119.1 hypothetical protein RLDS_24815 [Sphingobium lactosutens DS20]
MRRIADAALPLGLAAFFLIGGLVNGTASDATMAQYVAWGYPRWFPYVTAAMEGASVILLILARTRLVGAALGTAVMTAALATLIRAGEYLYAATPAALIFLSALAGCRALAYEKVITVETVPEHDRNANPWGGYEA